MTKITQPLSPIKRFTLGAVALLFGIATIKSGGDVLFWSESARIGAGHYIPFVLWANFIAGFFYVLCAVLIFLNLRSAFYTAVFIAGASVALFAALGIHIAVGGLFEMRTVAAMLLRAGLWISIAYLLRKLRELAARVHAQSARSRP